MYTYSILLVLTLAFPLMFSFDSRIKYYKKFHALFPSIFIMAVFMIVWDYFFTKAGIWSFNHKYITGYHVFNLPTEEVLFFFVVPFSCLFIYESVKYFVKTEIPRKTSTLICIFPALIFLVMSFVFKDLTYTMVCSAFLSFLLFVNALIIKPPYIVKFFLAYFVSLVPFFVFNGILTSGLKSIDENPVVIYSTSEITNFRIISIPVEDSFYLLFMLLLATNFYEFLLTYRRVEKH
ncbi:lycopene cyclase domain-containing protein [candidate division WOR-3 bacterium]|nr:lycopene cyclase domain-containing protein [candidate division WOR-3 bacterium]